ncbi:MAG: UpxY family transcription antiterminator [Saprospiraceae bacterium]
MIDIKNNSYNHSINQLTELEPKWFAVYTKYKCEKFVAGQLDKKNIEVYVPLVTRVKKYQRKKKVFEVPLINCYVFVKIKKQDYIRTLETDHVLKFLRQGKDLIAIPNEEIDLLKRVVGDVEVSINSSDFSFDFGEDVEVASGHLAGMKGKIVSKSGKKSFIVELETIGYQLRIKIDLENLRSIQKEKLIA